jgi:hypothetical protein
MAQQSPQSGGDSDDFFKLSIMAFIAIMIAMYYLGLQRMRINALIGAVTWVHILPFALADRYVPALSDIPFLGRWLFDFCHQGLDFLENGGFAAMSSEARNSVLIAGGRASTVIYGGILAAIALKGDQARVDQKYRTLHTLESMIYLQSDHWVTSRIARHINPLKEKEVDPRRLADTVSARISKNPAQKSGLMPYRPAAVRPGIWNRALRPEEWLVSNGLAFDMTQYKVLSDPERISETFEFNFHDQWVNLDLEEISEVLSAQLRAPWRGPEHLRPCVRAIYAVMALFYSYDISKGNDLINDLSLLSDACKAKPGGMDDAIRAEAGMLARIDKIAMGKEGRRLAQVAENHAWVESAFPTMLAASRKDRGVLPTAAFLWLKAEDRLLWYILNNVGNDAITVEAAGAIAHSRAETQIARPLKRPAVYQASRALLEDYLDMTPERYEARMQKAIAQRTPGEQLDLLRDEILEEARRKKEAPQASGSEDDDTDMGDEL